MSAPSGGGRVGRRSSLDGRPTRLAKPASLHGLPIQLPPTSPLSPAEYRERLVACEGEQTCRHAHIVCQRAVVTLMTLNTGTILQYGVHCHAEVKQLACMQDLCSWVVISILHGGIPSGIAPASKVQADMHSRCRHARAMAHCRVTGPSAKINALHVMLHCIIFSS